MVVGSLLVAGCGFLPWGASGRRERSSYALLAVVDRLDILDGPAAPLARLWYLAPVAAAVVWLAVALGRPAVARVVAAVLAGGGTVLAVVVRRSVLVDRVGTCATIVASGLVVLGLVLAAVDQRRRDVKAI